MACSIRWNSGIRIRGNVNHDFPGRIVTTTCVMAATDWIKPNSTVRKTVTTTNQNPHHLGKSLLSNHSCVRVEGVDLWKVSEIIKSRWLQRWKVFEFRWVPCLRLMFGSMNEFCTVLSIHTLQSESERGRTRLRVSRVSSMKLLESRWLKLS